MHPCTSETLELVGSLQLIAWTMLTRKEYEEAKSACANALGMTQKLLGPNSTTVASSWINLAIANINTGNIGFEVENMLKNALGVFKKSHDTEQVMTHNIGTALLQLGTYFIHSPIRTLLT